MNQNRQTITIINSISDCEKLFEFLNSFTRSNDISENIHNDLQLVVEETFTNIANYAHNNDETHSVTVELHSTTEAISITFTDTGIAFNPITDCIKNIENDDHCEGGMGIHIIKSLSDLLKYDRINQQNVFTVTKHYTK